MYIINQSNLFSSQFWRSDADLAWMAPKVYAKKWHMRQIAGERAFWGLFHNNSLMRTNQSPMRTTSASSEGHAFSALITSH